MEYASPMAFLSQIDISVQAGQDALPVRESERIASMDVIRGFALLGIMLINIPSMAMISSARINPHAYVDASNLDLRIWRLTNIFIDGRFITIFSLLFGAGVILFTSHIETKDMPSGPAYARRLLFLLVVGLLHAYLIWDGDVLVSYALCGATVFWFRKGSAKRLAIWSLVFFIIGAAFALETTRILRLVPELMPRQFSPAAETAALRGGFLDQIPLRVSRSIGLETTGFVLSSYWRITTAMLLGMVFAKAKLFSPNAKSKLFACLLLVLGFGIGLLVMATGGFYQFMYAANPQEAAMAGEIANYLSSIPVALGWIGIILLLMASPIGQNLTSLVAPLGRMAFTNYLMESFLGTAIFYGTGLGMFGKVHRGEQVLIVVAIWIVQIALSAWWMSRFQFGPLEWLWRNFVYHKIAPMRRRVAD